MVQLFADPFNLQGNNQNLQGSSGVNLQPASNPYGPTLPPVAPKSAPVAAPAPKQAPVSSPRIAAPSVNFYKPDPNSQQVYDANGTPLSYQQYIAAGGRPDFSNVLQQPIPVKQAQTYQQPSYQQTSYSPVPTDSNQQLARSAAAAGLSMDDYLKLISGSVSPDERNKIYSDLGITDLENQIFTPPSKTTQQLFTDAYAQAGLSDLKAQIQAKIAEITKARNDFTDASGQVNENPFLSEASRVGRVSRLNDKAEARIGNLNNELSQLTDFYNNGVNEVGSLVSRTTADFQANQALNAQRLQYLLQKAEQQVGDLQSSKTSEAYKYLPDYLTAKAAAQKPDTIQTPDGAVYQWNPDARTFTQVIAPNVTPNFQANPLTGELFNTKTGQTQGGSNYGAGLQFNTGSSGMRTDRHNNPTAFTTEVAKQAGLKEGVDYVAGDPFPNNPNLKTAKLLGDPIATTIKVIDNIGFYTQSGQPRWSYVNSIPDAKNWSNLNYEQKARVVAQMYQKEGGNGSLVQGSTGSTIDNLVQQVIGNPALLAQLPDIQQKAVVARMAQMGIPIPNTKQNTDAQNSASGYATRVQQSGTILDQLQSSIAKYNLVGFKAQQVAPNNLKSSTIQQYEQAARNFINAILRRESGAAIAQSEFDNAYRQYLPYPGDSAAVLAQKKQNRDAVLNSLKQSAGSAYGQTSGGSSNGGSSINLSDLNFSF